MIYFFFNHHLVEPQFQCLNQILDLRLPRCWDKNDDKNVVKIGDLPWDRIRKKSPYPPKTNITIQHPPLKDVFPIENGDVPMSC